MVTILMGTYNGEKYIVEQLESILNQTYEEFKIIIYDDCSKDNTFSILKEYEKRYVDKIRVFQNNKNTGNPKHNFLNMIINYKDDYVMLCDQDDVWKKNKIEVTLNEMKRMERLYGCETPILVHSDLTVVDENLNIIHNSFKHQMKANYKKTKLNNIVIQNTLTGCTGMINRSLSDLIVEEPNYCVMHDWWLVLVASAFGYISGMNNQTILYRQHGNNEIGAGNIRSFKYKFNRLINNSRIKEAVNETYEQTENFLNMYKEKLSEQQREMLRRYIMIQNLNKLNRIIYIFKYGFHKNTFIRKLAHIMFI